MEDEYTSRLHSVALSESESDESKKISYDKPIIKKKTCCFKRNDENACILCKCLDWCCCLITFQ
jgi:hypothetical protein